MKHPNKKHKLKHTTKAKLKIRIYLIKDKIIDKKIPCNMSTKSKIKAIKYKNGTIYIYKVNCKNATLLKTITKSR